MQNPAQMEGSFPQDIHRTNCVIIHYGELALKGGNRGWFEKILMSNLKANLEPIGITSIRNHRGRIVVGFADGLPWKAISDRISRVFGVASYAPAWFTEGHLENIEQAALSAVQGRQFRTFAVRARRGDKDLPYTSQEVNERVGSALVRWCDGAMVNLDNPELTVHIDALRDGAYVYIDKVRGPGGLPTGTAGRVISLISGGIDSPVAAWQMMKRGCEVDFVHFHSSPFTDAASQEKVVEIVGKLSAWQCGRRRLVMVPFGDIQRKIVTATHDKYRVILYRRFMVRIGEKIARELRAEAMVTGEALGQVASQTLSNIGTIDAVSNIPILRPLITMDKQEIVDMAKKIGTYELSILPHQDCCQFLEPMRPLTRSSFEELDEVERSLDIDALVKDGLTGAEWKDISKRNSKYQIPNYK